MRYKTSQKRNNPEPVAQQEPEKSAPPAVRPAAATAPDCGAVMGDATYRETFDEENQVEVQENDPEEMEGAEHPHKRTLAAISITIAIMKLARRQILN